MDMLHGKVALITGASAGIGKALAETFAQHGAAVGVIARRAERLGSLGSAATERPFAGEFVYMASKGAGAAMTRGMAATWGARGVRVNLIQPGVVESEFLEAAGLPTDVAAAMNQASVRLNALPAMGRAQDVAGAALFLASAQARFITGATLNVDGGFTLAAVPAG